MNTNQFQNTATEATGNNTGAGPNACCSTTEKSVCCQPADKAACCTAETERQALGKPACGCK
jgi:hypothetical protein